MDENDRTDQGDTHNQDQAASAPAPATQEDPLVRDQTGGQDVDPDSTVREGEAATPGIRGQDPASPAGTPPDSAAAPAATPADTGNAGQGDGEPAPGAGGDGSEGGADPNAQTTRGDGGQDEGGSTQRPAPGADPTGY